MFSNFEGDPYFNHQDSYLDMVSRRHINEAYAEKPVDFNVEGLRLANKYLSLGRKDKILDVGCSSGLFIIKGAEATNTQAEIIGLEPDAAVHAFLPPNVDDSRFTFVTGVGENIPLEDNSVKAASAHNMLFRAKDKVKVINEMKRVTEPGGLLLVSTNAIYHAFWRHTFERVIARSMSDDVGTRVEPAPTPAEGCYLEELPDILVGTGGLEVVERLVQFSEAKITRDRLEDYILPIKLSYNRTNLPAEDWVRPRWSQHVDEVVKPFIMSHIDSMEQSQSKTNKDEEPYFADLVFRGLIAAKNIK